METVVRVAFIYVFLLATLRVMGKREFGELSPLEFVSLLLIPEIVAQALVGNDFSMINAVVAALTLFALVLLNSFLTYLSPKAEDIIESTPTVLAFDGRVVESNMNRERITTSELYGELRKNGLERIDQVRWAVLEGDGKIAIVANEDSSSSPPPPEHGQAL